MTTKRHSVVFRRWSGLGSCLVLAIGVGAGPVRAQQPNYQPFDPTEAATPAPTVRRAQPVNPGDTDPPVARAVPVDPASTPNAKRRVHRAPAEAAAPGAAPARATYPAPGSNGPAEPVDPTASANVAAPAPAAASTGAAPAAPTRSRVGRPAAAPSDDTTPPTDNASDADSADDIRLAPQKSGKAASPDEVQFNLANALYVRKNYTQAAAEYERYLGQFTDGKQRQAAMWWLGESYRFLKRLPAARSSYQNLTVSFQEGEFVGPAYFRLATIDYEAKDYQTALGQFQRAAALAKGQDVRLYSRYSEALCLEQLGRRDETREVYDDIINTTGENPYRDAARLALANLAVSQKRFEEAFKQYEGLSREAAKPELQAESSLKAGILANDLDQKDTALALYKRAIELPGATAQVRADAMVAQLHLLYDTNKYQQLLDVYPTLRPALPETLQPEAVLMAANAQRQLGHHREARAAYDELISQFPRTTQATEARYQRIISLYASDDANFVKEADEYLLTTTDPVKTDQVRLMKADSLFKNRDYVAAALAYGSLDGSPSLPARYKAEAAYRLGFCYSQAKKPEQTITAFSRFLRYFPDSPLVPKALVLRAVAYQQIHRYPSALADFNSVISDHKDAREREGALAQKALILGAQNDSRGLIEAFRALLKDYPNTDVAALAHYSIANASFNDTKDYATARDEFDAARQAAPKEYGPKCSLMMIFCGYQLKDEARLATEIAAYEATRPTTPVPPTILRWLGSQEYEDKEYAAAEGHLSEAVATPGSTPEVWLQLARARIAQGKWDGAQDATQQYLKISASDPAARSLGLLVQGDAQIGMKRYDDAQKTIDEILQLQPEGTLNAKALLLRGKLEFTQGKYAQAAKSYMSVSVLYDDNELTPQALRAAAEAFEKAGEPGEATKAQEELKNRFPGFASADKVP